MTRDKQGVLLGLYTMSVAVPIGQHPVGSVHTLPGGLCLLSSLIPFTSMLLVQRYGNVADLVRSCLYVFVGLASSRSSLLRKSIHLPCIAADFIACLENTFHRQDRGCVPTSWL